MLDNIKNKRLSVAPMIDSTSNHCKAMVLNRWARVVKSHGVNMVQVNI